MSNQQQDAPLDYYRNKYERLDTEMAARRTKLVFDEENSRFTLHSLGFTIFAEWPDFSLVPEDRERCPKSLYGFGMQILAIRYLLESVNMPPRGQFFAYRELPWGELYDRNFQGRCVKRLAHGFGTRLSEFERAAENLGGIRRDFGDVTYDLPFFESVICRLILWGPDDELPPSSQFLFSDNVQTAFNAEDLAAAGEIIIDALKESAR